MKSDNEILGLTGLRFVAAFYVFIFHIHINWPLTNIEFLTNILEQGAVGMSLFFVLSGFILAYRYAGESTSHRKYLINRFARIYPIYITAAVLTLPWLGISLSGEALSNSAKNFSQAALLVITNIFLIQAWFPQFFSYWNNGGSWSISVEAFCYVLFPLVLPVLLRLSKKQLLFAITGLYLLAVLPGLSGMLFPGTPLPVYYAMPIYRAPEFLIGTCTLLIIRNFDCYQFNHWHQSLAVITVIIYFGFWGPMISNYVGQNWIVIPFVSFMILSLSSGRGFYAKLLANPFSVWLGKISYCFYSFQVLVLKLLLEYHDKLVKISPVFANGKFIFLIALTAILIISAAGYYLIEEPARRKLRAIYS